MSGPDAPGLEDLYEDISDTELAQIDLEDVEPDAPSHSDTAARGTSPDRNARVESNDGQPRRAQHHFGQYHVLSELEGNNFDLLNVTPDRPCTAYFNVSEDFTSRMFFESFSRIGIAPSGFRCLQRRPTGEVMVTFSKPEYRDKFLQDSPLIERRRYATHLDDCDLLIFLTVYDAPYELPDSAIEHCLWPYCKVVSRHRGKLLSWIS